MAEDALKSAKTDRRTAKGTLTRCGKSLAKLIDAKRPEQEVRDGLHKLQLAFDNLVAKHENYSRLIEDDSDGYTWLYTALHGYTRVYMRIHGYTRLYITIHGYRRRYMEIHGNT